MDWIAISTLTFLLLLGLGVLFFLGRVRTNAEQGSKETRAPKIQAGQELRVGNEELEQDRLRRTLEEAAGTGEAALSRRDSSEKPGRTLQERRPSKNEQELEEPHRKPRNKITRGEKLAANERISQEELKRILHYEESTDGFYWKTWDPKRNRRLGDRAGTGGNVGEISRRRL